MLLFSLLVDTYFSKRSHTCNFEKLQASKLFQKTLIEESYSLLAVPVTLAYKKEDGIKSRVCLDFRDLNKIRFLSSNHFHL